MKKFIKNLSLKKVLYAVLIFIMALCMVLCSLVLVLRITFFNPGFLSDTLNSTQYYQDLCVEITDDLTDLGDASGLNKAFFEGFVSEVMVREDVQNYINSFYKGEKLKVNTSKFDESLQTALNKYIKAKKLQNVKEENLNYFSSNACKIYSDKIKIKYLDAIQDLILNYTPLITFAIVILILIIAAIVCVIIFTNEWKHKALRYIYTALSSSGLFLLILPISVLLSGVAGHVSVISRSLSDMTVSIIYSVLSDLIVISIVLIVISIAVWVIHSKVRKKATL